MIIFYISFIIGVIILMVYTIKDILNTEFKKRRMRQDMMVLVCGFPFVGSLIYWVIRKDQVKRTFPPINTLG